MSILDLFCLNAKKVIITGGANGIGFSIGMTLAEAGAHIAIVDIDEESAKIAAQKIKDNTGRNCIAVKADVTSSEEVNLAIKEVLAAFGEIDIAVCNAGIVKNIPVEKMSLNQWNKVISVNLTGVFLTAQAVGLHMIKRNQGGSIIVIGSMAGHIIPYPYPQCSYNSSKAAVIQLVKSLAVEWGRRNIRVNSISPGYIDTNFLNETPKTVIESWVSKTPLNRLGRPEDIGPIAVYLASDASSFVTGADFVIDGGFTLT